MKLTAFQKRCLESNVKTIMIAGMVMGLAGLSGCNRSPAPASTVAAQADGTAVVQNAVSPGEPAVELKRVTSISRTQHQFKIVAHLPAVEPSGK